MQGPRSRPPSARLQPLVESGTEAATLASALHSTWRGVDAALNPIIGSLGVAALYRRSVHLTIPMHPVLSAFHVLVRADSSASAATAPDGAGGSQGGSDLTRLSAVLAGEDLAAVAAAGDALLQTLCDLLITLVGPILADRLLDRVWSPPSSGLPVQDSSA